MDTQISVVMTPESLAQTIRLVQDLKAAMPYLVGANSSERKGQNIGPEGFAYGQEAVRTAEANPEAMSATVKNGYLSEDINFYTAVSDIEAQLLTLLQSIDNTKVLVGQSIMRQSNFVYDDIKIAAKRDNKYKPAATQLGLFYKKRNKRGPKK